MRDFYKNVCKHLRVFVLPCGVVAILQPLHGFATQHADIAGTGIRHSSASRDGQRAGTAGDGLYAGIVHDWQCADTVRDGQHDFDFEIGTWKTHLKRRLHPLTGSTTWVEYEGVSVVHKIWSGQANMVELEATGPAGHFMGLNLRLYNPQSHQWSLNFASPNGGAFGVPTIGEFKNGRGEFYDQETYNDRAILVRFVITEVTADSCHFEQAFSDDGGKTWEINWIADDSRVKG
jgi:hypothetical protein